MKSISVASDPLNRGVIRRRRCCRRATGRAVYPFAMCSNGGFIRNKEYPIAMMDTGARMVRVDGGFINARRIPGDDPNAWELDRL